MRTDWTALIRNEREQIERECALIRQEREVFLMRADGASVVETAMKLHMSESTVKRKSARVRRKIERLRAMQRRKTREESEPEQARP